MEKAPLLNEWTPEPEAHKARWHNLPRLVPAVIASGLVALLFSAILSGKTPSLSLLTSPHNATSQAGPQNATLGFGAVLLLTLPERTDRQDAMSLIASISGIEITKTIYGVRGESIPDKARPYGSSGLTNNYLGSWRSHMNCLRYIVDNHIETALILEDDVDWDTRIKSQLSALSRGMANSPLRDRTSTPVSPEHPYGMDWDIMHLGPGIVTPPTREPYRHMRALYEDPERTANLTCPQNYWSEELYCWPPVLEHYGVPNNSRAILPSVTVAGLPAIAVTLEGARRILYQLSWVELPVSLDWSIKGLLTRGEITGWTVVPPFFSQYKAGGDHDSDLDVTHTVFQNASSNLLGISPGIENSVRHALTDRFAPKPNAPGRWTEEYWKDRGGPEFASALLGSS